jgi:AmmeMemoRadiSam system protein B
VSAPIRHPVVAGKFYPADPEKLRREIEGYVAPQPAKIRAWGCLAPHAGYVYSGHVAGAVYARLELPQRFLMLCPNHTGVGEPLAVVSRGGWLTPLGEVAIDAELADALKRECPALREDETAHAREHALEVQLPFLQRLLPEFTFLPIAVGTGQPQALLELGMAIARVLRALPEKQVLIVASSDMNHYEDDQRTRVKDRMAIEKMLALDPAGLWQVVEREQITMCGYGPAVVMLTAARQLGATQVELVKYATSGDISADRDWVVGYAGMVVY